MKFFSKKKKGQGLVEYIILIGLIALLVWVAVNTFGGKIKDQFDSAAKSVGGLPTTQSVK